MDESILTITVPEAARRLNKSAPTVMRYIRLGKLRAKVDPDGRFRIKPADLSAFFHAWPDAKHEDCESCKG
jgi:excisionase family DNA binding protein